MKFRKTRKKHYSGHKKQGGVVSLDTRLDHADRLIKEYIQVRSWNVFAPVILKRYQKCYSSFLDYLRTKEKLKDLRQIDRRVISRYRMYLAQRPGGKNGGFGIEAFAIQDLLLWLERRGVCFRRPSVSAELPPRLRRVSGSALKKNDIEKIIGAVDTNTPRGLRDKAILMLHGRYAVRAGEIAALTLTDFQKECGLVSVKSHMRSENRTLNLKNEAADCVRQYLEHGREKFPEAGKQPRLFLREDGSRMKLWHVALILQRYARKAGFERYVSGKTVRALASGHERGGERE